PPSPSLTTRSNPPELHRPRLHAALHSFPTRRSSDLASRLRSRPLAGVVLISDGVDNTGRPGFQDWEDAGVPIHTVADEHHARERSEEHTSELQSRSDLVCRLLHEKKKKERE